MQKISAYILAFNEAEKIADAVSSVLWADEIVVADSGSSDGTVEIAQSLGARVVQLPFHGFGDLRNRAVAECRYEWIFSLDSDERCTAEVREDRKSTRLNSSHTEIYPLSLHDALPISFHGFGDLRNRAVAECRYEWIFSLDSDERCTAEVRDEILAVLSSPTPVHDAYLVPRRNYMMGRWIKGSGWYPNFRQPQLFRKGTMRYAHDP